MENMAELRNKKILVTGGAGFIGGHLVEELISLGATVTVVDIAIEKSSYLVKKSLVNKIDFVLCDIRSYEKVLKVIEEGKFDHIVHLAAQTLVQTALRDPRETFDTNILGTVNVLEAARVLKVMGIIIASSDKAYGESSTAYTESTPLNGRNVYDSSKSSADIIAQTYYKNFQLPVIITRCGNVYGQGDLNAGRIVPDICNSIISKKTLKIRSNGKYTRDYVYVKDVVSAYVFLLKSFDKNSGQAFNVSSQESYSVLDLVKKTQKVLKIKIPYKILNVVKHEIVSQHLSDKKLRTLGWKSKYTFDEKISEIVEWYKSLDSNQ